MAELKMQQRDGRVYGQIHTQSPVEAEYFAGAMFVCPFSQVDHYTENGVHRLVFDSGMSPSQIELIAQKANRLSKIVANLK